MQSDCISFVILPDTYDNCYTIPWRTFSARVSAQDGRFRCLCWKMATTRILEQIVFPVGIAFIASSNRHRSYRRSGTWLNAISSSCEIPHDRLCDGNPTASLLDQHPLFNIFSLKTCIFNNIFFCFFVTFLFYFLQFLKKKYTNKFEIFFPHFCFCF